MKLETKYIALVTCFILGLCHLSGYSQNFSKKDKKLLKDSIDFHLTKILENDIDNLKLYPSQDFFGLSFTKNSILRVINNSKTFYGEVIDYKRTDIEFYDKEMVGYMVKATYFTNFKNCVGYIILSFHIGFNNELWLYRINFKTPNYHKVPNIMEIVKPIIDGFRSKDLDKIWPYFSLDFMGNPSNDEINSVFEKLFQYDYEKFVYYNHSVGYVKDKEYLTVYYEYKVTNTRLMLVFIKEDGTYKLQKAKVFSIFNIE